VDSRSADGDDRRSHAIRARIYLSGGWGYGNLGDDAILKAMLRSIHDALPGCAIVLTSFNPEETRFHHGVEGIASVHRALRMRSMRFVPRMLRTLLWLTVHRLAGASWILPPVIREHYEQMRAASVVVLGGGGYFNDRWLTALPGRLTEIVLAAAADRPLLLYGQTVGPFASWLSRRYFDRVLKRVAFVTYRDIQSRRTLERYGFDLARAEHTADEAVLLPATGAAIDGPAARRPTIGVMVQKFRPYEGVDGTLPLGRIGTEDRYLEEISTGLALAARKLGATLMFIPSTRWDYGVCRAVYARLRDDPDAEAQLLEPGHVDDFVRACQGVDVMVSTNMHPLILAACAARPVVGLSYFYKLDDFMRSLDLDRFVLRIDDWASEDLSERIVAAFADRASLGQSLGRRIPGLQDRARRNVHHLARVLEASARLESAHGPASLASDPGGLAS
jgi:polysaccharide pyruvyl transferase WcaK-like protein